MGSFTISKPLLQVWRDQICYRDPEPGPKSMQPQDRDLGSRCSLFCGAVRRPNIPCSPCHGAGPGWLSEHSEQGSCPAASCQQLLYTWAQLRHSLDTAQTQLDTAQTQLCPALTQSDTPWTLLDTAGHSRTQLDTAHHDPPGLR